MLNLPNPRPCAAVHVPLTKPKGPRPLRQRPCSLFVFDTRKWNTNAVDTSLCARTNLTQPMDPRPFGFQRLESLPFGFHMLASPWVNTIPGRESLGHSLIMCSPNLLHLLGQRKDPGACKAFGSNNLYISSPKKPGKFHRKFHPAAKKFLCAFGELPKGVDQGVCCLHSNNPVVSQTTLWFSKETYVVCASKKLVAFQKSCFGNPAASCKTPPTTGDFRDLSAKPANANANAKARCFAPGRRPPPRSASLASRRAAGKWGIPPIHRVEGSWTEEFQLGVVFDNNSSMVQVVGFQAGDELLVFLFWGDHSGPP